MSRKRRRAAVATGGPPKNLANSSARNYTAGPGNKTALRRVRTHDGLTVGIDRLHAEAAGCFDVFVIRPEDLPGLAAPMHAGDRRAVAFLNAIQSFFGGPAKTCLGCDAACDPPGAIALVVPSNDAATAALAMGACDRCARASAAEISRKMQWWLRRVWPELREVTVSAEGGRA